MSDHVRAAFEMENDCVEACGGGHGGFVYFMQWQLGGALKVGTAGNVAGRMASFAAGHPTPPVLRCVAPGGQAQEHWFHRRHAARRVGGEWYAPAEPVVSDALEFRRRCELALEAKGPREARLTAVRQMDPELADLEHLYRNGASMRQIAELSGLGVGVVKKRIETMRALGFNLRFRRAYASRSPRYERLAPERGDARLIG